MAEANYQRGPDCPQIYLAVYPTSSKKVKQFCQKYQLQAINNSTWCTPLCTGGPKQTIETGTPETTLILTIQDESTPTSSSLESPTVRTLFNPFRCSRRQITLPKTPNLINLSSTPTSSY